MPAPQDVAPQPPGPVVHTPPGPPPWPNRPQGRGLRVRVWWPLQRRLLALGGTWLLALRARLQALVRRLGPAELTLYEDGFAHLTTQTLLALVQGGVFEAMGDGAPHTADVLAARLQLDASVLRRLLRYGATRGWVRACGPHHFALARGGMPLRSSAQASMAPFVTYAADASSVAAAAAAPEVLRRGGSGFGTAHNVSVWPWLAEHPAVGAAFDAAMTTLSGRDVVHVGRALAQLAPGNVCDLGGGRGALLRAVLEAQPGARGTLVERPDVLPAAQEHFTSAGLAARATCVPGDLFALPPLSADAFVLRNIVHDWDDADVVRILRQVRANMRAHDALFLVETVEGAAPTSVEALSDVAMLLMTDGGRQRGVAALRALGEQAGLTLVQEAPLPLPMRLLWFRAAHADGKENCAAAK